MYLSEIRIKNFRCFDETEHVIAFNSGLTVLVGENDSGKSAIIDAIRIVMGTTDFSWIRLEPEDFHNEDTSVEISITCRFSALTPEEQASFLECLTYDEKKPCLYLHWTCRYLKNFKPARPSSELTSGKDGNGPSPLSDARELLRTTYLRPLRDAYSEMRSGRHSRLSQIIQKLSGVDVGSDIYSEDSDLNSLSLVGIANLSNTLLANHTTLKSINNDMTEILNDQILLEQDDIKTRLSVAGTNNTNDQKLNTLLEKLDLVVDRKKSVMQGQVGLGTSNIMSMACELLLHKDAEAAKRSAFLLIEEPEAHVHAQRQLKLVQSLENDAERGQHQIIITTHSPLLASVVKLSTIVIIKNSKTYPMSYEFTKLEGDDYVFLEKYLDATKANLFFARSVLIVEGPGEELLIPTIAKLIGKSFTNYGTSLVDVRSTGLRRYARIFQRKNNAELLNIKVACVTDRDIMPDCAPGICIDDKYIDKANWPKKTIRHWETEADYTRDTAQTHIDEIKAKADGQNVKTFVADHWTLEYDLAYKGLVDDGMREILVDSLVKVIYKPDNQEKMKADITTRIGKLTSEEEKASFFYAYFKKEQASKADFAQQLAISLEKKYKDGVTELRAVLPPYLVAAIDYAVAG